jgi:hypothetical protein
LIWIYFVHFRFMGCAHGLRWFASLGRKGKPSAGPRGQQIAEDAAEEKWPLGAEMILTWINSESCQKAAR